MGVQVRAPRQEVRSADGRSGTASVEVRWSVEFVSVAVGIALLVVPTVLSLAREYWSTDNGAHGPILFFSGLWLIWRERSEIRFRAAPPSLVQLAALSPVLLLYIYGRAFRVLTLETAALYLLVIGLAYVSLAPGVLRRLWFPILYLGFLIRPPAGFIAEATQPLKIWISVTATDVLHWAGYAIASSGVRIQIDQYELLVQQACAGLGSIFSLLAIGLLYLHLASRSQGLWRAALLVSIIPIAVLANLLRVVILILLTVHFGQDVAQGFAHEAAGITTFALSLVGLIALDHAAGMWRRGTVPQ